LLSTFRSIQLIIIIRCFVCKKVLCIWRAFLKYWAMLGCFAHFGICSFLLYKFEIHAVFSLCLFILWPVPFNLLRTHFRTARSFATNFLKKNHQVSGQTLSSFCHILEDHSKLAECMQTWNLSKICCWRTYYKCMNTEGCFWKW